MLLTASDVGRFWRKVARAGRDDCWPWTGRRTGGAGDWYGQLTVGGRRSEYAHRIAWNLAYGSIPKGVEICHHCDVPHCCNPSHLFLGTRRDNMRDASNKGRLPRGTTRRTREFKAVVIARYLGGGISAKALATEYGVAMLSILRWVHAAGVGDLRSRSGRRKAAA
jgi:hypothetical protein